MGVFLDREGRVHIWLPSPALPARYRPCTLRGQCSMRWGAAQSPASAHMHTHTLPVRYATHTHTHTHTHCVPYGRGVDITPCIHGVTYTKGHLPVRYATHSHKVRAAHTGSSSCSAHGTPSFWYVLRRAVALALPSCPHLYAAYSAKRSSTPLPLAPL